MDHRVQDFILHISRCCEAELITRAIDRLILCGLRSYYPWPVVL
jgi:hypothetical protein